MLEFEHLIISGKNVLCKILVVVWSPGGCVGENVKIMIGSPFILPLYFDIVIINQQYGYEKLKIYRLEFRLV